MSRRRNVGSARRFENGGLHACVSGSEASGRNRARTIRREQFGTAIATLLRRQPERHMLTTAGRRTVTRLRECAPMDGYAVLRAIAAEPRYGS